ncbi:MAG: ATP-dependent Clp protease ATP-binding subunit ClpC, partial [Caballeronia sp.]|nr:ATP-dependent Clp protease ATP-binding subunit ClpC [Caballeronia sp.]
MATCSVCGKPATSQIAITENGQRRLLTLCDEHYTQFMAHRQPGLSPLESLFHGALFESLFDDMWSPLEGRRGGWQPLGQADETTRASAGEGQGRAGGRPRRHRRAREAVDLQTFLSESGLDRLQA